MTTFLAVETNDPLKLCRPLTADHSQAGNYHPPQGLEQAMDVAMMLGEPLVLTGAPGAGKTQAAVWLTHTLRAGELLRFDVKSTTLGADLLYTFDDVARFRDAAAREPKLKPLVRYLRFNALGEGILRAAGGEAVLLTTGGEPLEGAAALTRHARLIEDAFGASWTSPDGAVRVADLLPDESGFRDAGRRVRVVLIDELDKAPRDTPNDLLAEVENMTFMIPELGLRVKTDRAVRPIVIITSNAEKPLPEPFLRRCAYFDVPRVEGDDLAAVIAGSVTGLKGGGRLVTEAVQMIDHLRGSHEIERQPGTAELLAWMEVVVRIGGLKPAASLRDWVTRQAADGGQLAVSLGALLKHKPDQALGREIILGWADGSG